jgi:hypothetical protein
MYARNVSLKLKANSAPEFARLIEKEIIPLLRKQKGFQDEISFVSPNVMKQWLLASGITRMMRNFITTSPIWTS